MHRFRTLSWLAGRDYIVEWQMSGFAVLALAAVLGPMLILFGLKNGIVGSMLDQLVHQPKNLEIRSVGSGRFNQPMLDSIGNRVDVSFVTPEFKGISSSIQLKSDKAGRIIKTELKPTGQGDPMLTELVTAPEGMQIILSASIAKALQASKGDVLQGRVGRFFRGSTETEMLKLTVVGVLESLTGISALAPLPLVESISDYRDGREVTSMGWEGYALPVTAREYPGFRMYARSIYDVSVLEKDFALKDIAVQSQSTEIDLVKSIDKNLTAIYWLVAIIGLLGYTLSLGANLWGNVDRKRRDLAVLRVVGFRTGDIIWVPVLQALYTAILGWGLAVAVYFLVGKAINAVMAGQLSSGQTVCKLEPWHFVAAFVLTMLAAVLSAMLAGYRASRIEPADGLRDI
ncbi:MAG TPA: peptide ABC transporter permease [Gammaproteobacteria bacterium]|nr:peptide ABC transporter permease [Gammaproteobacteria bacterium]